MAKTKNNKLGKKAQPARMSIWQGMVQFLFPKPKQKTLHHFLDNQFFMHAMSQPLTNATLLLEMALQQQDQQSNFTKSQLRQALTQLKYLQSLFKLSNQSAIKSTSFNLQQTLNELVHRHHHPQNHNILTPVFQLPSNPQIAGNPFLFQEALSCLITNAFEAYDPRQKNRYVLLAAYEKRNHVVLYLGDIGPGVNVLTQHLINLKGFTLKNTGHGLGVSYAQKVIAQHLGGTCKLISTPEVGTIFMISIPIKGKLYNRSLEQS